MAATNALGSPRTSTFTISGTDNPYFAKINWIFTFSMACVAAGISYCVYNLYQVYQLATHTGYGLDDPFKLVKCKALLAGPKKLEILFQCESLLNTIKDSRHSVEKEKLLLQLAKHYSTNDPQRSLSTAQMLTSPDLIFDAVQHLITEIPNLKEAPSIKNLVGALNKRAYEAKLEKLASPQHTFIDIDWCLEVAESVHALDEELSQSIIAKMLGKAYALTDPMARVSAFCRLAKSAHYVGSETTRDVCLGAAQQQLSQKRSDFQSEFLLVDAYFSIKAFHKLDTKLDEIISRFSPMTIDAIPYIHRLAKLIHAINKDKTNPSHYINYSVEDLMRSARDFIPHEKAPKNRIKAYLDIADIHQDKLIDNQALHLDALTAAFYAIKKLPTDTGDEFGDKVTQLIRLFPLYKHDSEKAKEIMHNLEELYDKYLNAGVVDLDKYRLGALIVQLGNEMGLSTESETFFSNKYLPLLQHGTPFDIIDRLTYHVQTDFLPKHQFKQHQKLKMLQIADSLLSQCSGTQYQEALHRITDSYVDVNSNRSLSLLASLEIPQAKIRLLTCGIFFAVFGAVYFYLATAPATSLASRFVQLLNRY